MSNITLNIVEPASPTPIPVDPGTGTVVPNTGLFTSGIGGAEAAVIATVGLVAILAIIGAIIYYRKHKQGNTSNIFAKCKHTIKSKKYASGLAVLALLVSIGTVAGLLKLSASAEEADSIEAQDSTALTVTAESEELTIELGDEPVFAVLPVDITVEEATVAGYTLTAYAEDTNLVSTADSGNIIPMVAADEGELAILADNTYGLALAEPEDKDSEVYASLSTDSLNPTIIKSMPEYTPTEENDTTTIYYGFYITPDIPYGTYTGSDINYLAEPNYITTLAFNGNGSDGGEAISAITIAAGDTITLPQNTYTREGYSFTGWNTKADGSGDSYADEADFTASLTQSEDITLYAQWKLPPTINDLVYMQDFASLSAEDKTIVLKSMSQEATYILKDRRDEQEYTIAKLKDNNIWMTKNLNLAGGTEITSELSNVPDNYTLPTANGFQDGNKLPASSTSGFNDSTKAFVYNSTKTSGTDCSSPGCYSYYSWTAATAGSGLSITAGDTDAPYSVCPKGWKLPNSRSTVTGNSDFYKLAVAYGMDSGNTWQSTANFYDQAGPGATSDFLLSGFYNNGSFYNGDSYGYYWSSTSSGDSYARNLFFNSSSVRSASGDEKHYGQAVRCILE